MKNLPKTEDELARFVLDLLEGQDFEDFYISNTFDAYVRREAGCDTREEILEKIKRYLLV